ncbi:MAG: hypothetical protein HY912_18830 [Desulfomonile tiedjei]|uniref:NapC/NirT cytochrome c N-terminal domain-containing protein n=1 Tax=Desulfomonile tiedjei TaxID=2358 RepID=A0A9D6Z529_9BACT|nr:hypothetical protein [Desulfomonile tiedjei]
MGKAWQWYLIGLAIVVVAVAGLAELSVQSSSCMACHTQEAAFSEWMSKRLKAEKKGFSHELIACADCHMKGGAARTVGSRLDGLLHSVTYLVPQLDPRKPLVSGMFSMTKTPTENCQYCHLAAINRKSVHLKDLTPELVKIGLVMDHRKHVLARDDTCAKCHERYKEKGAADKAVAYTEVNHLACDSCHTRASHSYRSGQLLPMTEAKFLEARQEAWNQLSKNPRWMIAMPSEQSCRRCHNGKIHYKTRIFLADCNNGKNFDDCMKCHPLMTKEYFEQHRRKMDQRSLALDTDRKPGNAK